MHSQNIAHRDIKLENILIDTREKIKIVDFGFSINFNLKDYKLIKNSICGSPCYMAPELVSFDPKLFDYCAIDIWALGVLLFKMLTGYFPFTGDNSNCLILKVLIGKDERVLFKKIKKGKFIIPKKLSKKVKTLLTDILKINSKDRLNSQQVNFLLYKS